MHIVSRRYFAIAAFLGFVLFIYLWAYRLDQSVVIGIVAAFLVISGSSAAVWTIMGPKGWAYLVGGIGLVLVGGFFLVRFGAHGNTILGFIMGGVVIATNALLVLRRATKQLTEERVSRLKRMILLTGLISVGAFGLIIQLATYLGP